MNRRKKSGRSFFITCAILFSLIFIALVGGIVLSFVNIMPGKKASVNVDKSFQTNSAGYATTGSVAYNEVIKLGSGAVAVSPTPSPTPTPDPMMFAMIQNNNDEKDDQDKQNDQDTDNPYDNDQDSTTDQNTDSTPSIGGDDLVDETPTEYGDYDYVVYYDYGTSY